MTHEMLAFMVVTGVAIMYTNLAGCGTCYYRGEQADYYLRQEFYSEPPPSWHHIAQRCPVCGTILIPG